MKNEIIFTHNDCYKENRRITPIGIVVHSTGANNPYLRRYVAPDDGKIGKNAYNNDWNRPGVDVCVHGFVGLDKNEEVQFYKTLPFDYRCWGCGGGSKGSYNNTHIQFEICEDDLTDKDYFDKAFYKAAEVCAILMKTYGIKLHAIVSHKEAHDYGYASGHGDPDHWLKKFGKDMNWFRNLVQEVYDKMYNKKPATKDKTVSLKKGDIIYKESSKIDKDGTYTITEEKNGMGKLKSGAGWVKL